MADELPSPMGRYFIDMVQKSFLQYVYLCIPPKHIFNIINFAGIVGHITFTFPSHYSINFNVKMPMSVYILIFLHIFYVGMLGINSG